MPDLKFRLFGQDVSLSKAMDKGGDAVKGLGKTMEGLGPVAAGAGAAAATALSAGLFANMDAEAANDKLAAQLGASESYSKNLGKIAGSLYANAYGESVGEVNDAIRGVLQQGLLPEDATNAQIESLTGKVMSLASTFDQDLGGTTAAVSQMIRNGLARDAGQAMDILTRGFQQGANKADDLLETLNEYGTQFRNVGLTGDQAMGLITQGLRAGARDADVVADTIKEFSIEAVAGGDRVMGGFKSLGLNAKEMSAAFAKGGPTASKALDTVFDRLRGIEDPLKRNQVAIELFGTKAEDMGDALFALDPSSAVDGLGRVDGAASKLDKTLNDNAKTTLTTFQRKLQSVFTQGAADVIKFGMEHQAAVVPMLATLASLTGVVLAVGAATKAWAAIQAVIKGATVAWTAVQWLLNAALTANPIGLIVVGIAALIAVIVLIATKTTWFQTIWKATWGAIKAAAAAVWNWLKGAADAVWGWLKAGLSGLNAAWKATWGAIKAAAAAVWTWLKTAAAAVWNFWKAGVRGWLMVIRGVFATVKSVASGAWNVLRTGASNAWSFITTKVRNFVNFFKGLPGRVRSAATGMFDPVWNAFRSAINRLISGWNRLSFTLPSVSVPGIGKVGGFTLSTPDIPHLATGGRIVASGLAMVHRGERVIPAAQVRDRGRGGDTYYVDVRVDRPLGTPNQLRDAFVEAFERATPGGKRLPRTAVATR